MCSDSSAYMILWFVWYLLFNLAFSAAKKKVTAEAFTLEFNWRWWIFVWNYVLLSSNEISGGNSTSEENQNQKTGGHKCQDWMHSLSSAGHSTEDWNMHPSRGRVAAFYLEFWQCPLQCPRWSSAKWASPIWTQLSPQSDVSRQNTSPERELTTLGPF